MELSFIQTITLAILIVLLGAKFRSKVKILEELALPVATLGGLLYFLFSQIASEVGLGQLVFKFNADRPFMLAFSPRWGWLPVSPCCGRAVNSPLSF